MAGVLSFKASLPQPVTELLTVSDFAALAVTFFVGFCLRSILLMQMFPILIDESIYLRWAEIIDHQHEWFISLLDGKPPLVFWLFWVVRLMIPNDPLMGCRFLSVLCGSVSTGLMFLIGWRLGGKRAGHFAALLYSIFPYAVLYERIAYTEAYVNASGMTIIYVTLKCLDSPCSQFKWFVILGVVLGLGIWCKTTVCLFSFFPVLAVIIFNRSRLIDVFSSYCLTAALVSPIFILRPSGPTFPEINSVVHRTDFFVSMETLRVAPLFTPENNLHSLSDYMFHYITEPALLAIALSLIYLLFKQPFSTLLLVSIAALPLFFQLCFLRYFPSRYVFPHCWPGLLLISLAITDLSKVKRLKSGAIGTLIVIFICLGWQSIAILISPKVNLSRSDSGEFLGSSPYAGYGSSEAIAYLKDQAKMGALTILTDPYWGPPADPIFAYLNQREGIQVYEAWWLQLPGKVRVLPLGPIATMRSQYQRIPGDIVDFSAKKRVFFVTDSSYFSEEDIKSRQEDAVVVAEFLRPDRSHVIRIYRLR